MRVAIGCDNAGFPLMMAIKPQLIDSPDMDINDFGVASEGDLEYYPDIAERVAAAVAEGSCERGILICGTGLGMAIVANKVPGVRAATCHDVYSAERARMSNNAQILTLGARVIGVELAKTVVRAWLGAEFSGGGSAPKLQRILEIERKYLRIE